MSFRRGLLLRAARRPARIALPDAEFPAVQEAAARLARDHLAEPILVGPGALDPATDPRLQRVAQRLREARPEQVRDGVHALDLAADPLRFAAGLVALGDADGLVAGVSATTAEVLDAARWAIGAESGLAVAALVGYLTLKDRSLALAFGVAGAETAAAELAAIGGLAVRDWTRLQDDPACVAFLSAGTHGSVATVAAERVRAAAGRFREQHPEIKADGEVDLWAALQSGANVLVFPNHDAGHLAWQLARWLGAECMGPLVRGVSRPVGALSRDAALDDIVVMAALVAALGATAQTEVKR